MPVSRGEIIASRFWSLQTQLHGNSEVSCAPESDPLVDVGLTFFAVDDGVEYPRRRRAITRRPGPQAFDMGELVKALGAVRTCSDCRPRVIVVYGPGRI